MPRASCSRPSMSSRPCCAARCSPSTISTSRSGSTGWASSCGPRPRWKQPVRTSFSTEGSSMTAHPTAAGGLGDTREGWAGHPRGLSTLFFTEMWERFSYYGMRALLILFMTAAPVAGGMGFDAATAGAVYGLYTSMVYMTGLPGGWLADRLLGPQRAVLYGGILIACGHFSMAVPSQTTFYLGLLLIVIGTGLLKGNVAVIVGRLYAPADARRDAGYSIYYMGINLGAFIAPLIVGYLGQRVSWHVGFGAAGLGMVFGLIQYMAGIKHLGEAGREPADAGSAAANLRQKRQAVQWTTLAAGIVVVVVIAAVTGLLPLSPTAVADAAGYLLLGLTGAFFAWIFFSPGW